MSEDRLRELTRQAADIFLQLRDDPDNAELQARRDEFRARGKDECEAYDDLAKTWKASGVMHAPKKLRSLILFFCGLIGASAIAYEPIRIAVFADLSTSRVPEQSTLESGDFAYLDADSALVDDTDGEDRRVELLTGAAFFDVESNARPFSVEVGDITITVVGTSFETAFVDETVLIGVAEGQVNVRRNDQVWELSAGDQLTWSDEIGADIDQRDSTNMASWRGDRLVVNNLTLGQAAAIIERRLAGPVVFTSGTLRDTRVNGNLDLSEPLKALRILADTGGGRVYNVPGVGRVISPR